MSFWFYINALIVLFTIWKIITGYHGFHMVLGGIGLLFIIYNWTRHAVFSTIRSKKVHRKRKIFYATLSKKVLPIHKWTGTLALVIILVHMLFVLKFMGFHFHYIKMVTGFIALFFLLLVVLTGWLRWYRTTVTRRYLHWTIVYILIFSVIIHIIL